MMRTLFFIAMMALAVPFTAAADDIIYEKISLYRNITVTDDGNRVCMQFASKGYYVSQQSCQYKDDPDKLVFDYAKLTMAGLIVNPDPERILVVGLGGGTLPKTLHQLYPEAQIDSVEIDPAVVEVAERYFDFEESENVKVIARDGRVFVKQAQRFNREYDFIILDAFNGDYIPEHLMTKEWLEEVKSVLADGGVVIANTFSSSRLYNNESVTYEAAFGWIRNIRPHSGNRLIITGKFDPITRKELLEMARQMDQEKFDKFGVDLEWVATRLHDEPDWNEEARVLTDQYSPVNLLQGD